MIIFCLIFPFVLLTVFFLVDEVEVGFGFIFSFLIIWVVGFYCLRLYLWNRYGKENYHVTSDKFEYSYSYRFFNSNLKKIQYKTFQIGYYEQIGKYLPCFMIDEEIIESTTALTEEEFDQLLDFADPYLTTDPISDCQ